MRFERIVLPTVLYGFEAWDLDDRGAENESLVNNYRNKIV